MSALTFVEILKLPNFCDDMDLINMFEWDAYPIQKIINHKYFDTQNRIQFLTQWEPLIWIKDGSSKDKYLQWYLQKKFNKNPKHILNCKLITIRDAKLVYVEWESSWVELEWLKQNDLCKLTEYCLQNNIQILNELKSRIPLKWTERN